MKVGEGASTREFWSSGGIGDGFGSAPGEGALRLFSSAKLGWGALAGGAGGQSSIRHDRGCGMERFGRS
jgi:hypothetical protein